MLYCVIVFLCEFYIGVFMLKNIETEIDEILNKMTVEEKVAMCRANSKFSSNGVERLGIDELKMTDGPHGIRGECERHRWMPLNRKEDECTYLPTGSAIASTWNKELAFDFGDVLGAEGRARGKDIILGPGINIMRTPLCGRNFEYFSEDVCLNSKMSVPLIQGIQNNDIAACVKHYAFNNQELARNSVNVRTSKRAMYETYLAGFKAAVQSGGAYAVMGAYNKYNGEYCCHNKYLVNDVLKEEFGFDGVYLSDWAGCHNLEEAVFGGLDIEMGTCDDYEKFYFSKKFVEMAQHSSIVAEILNDKVGRILRLMFKIRKFEPDRKKGEFNTKRHQKIAYNIAAEAMVLLKNDGNILPLNSKKIKKLLVLGENATMKHAQGGNSSNVSALYEVSLLDGLRNRLNKDVDITYIPCIDNGEKPIKAEMTEIVDEKAGCRGFKLEKFDNFDCKGTPVALQYVAEPLLSGIEREEYTYLYSAIINIAHTDDYTFYLSGKRGVELFINGELRMSFYKDTVEKRGYTHHFEEGEKVKISIRVIPHFDTLDLKLGWVREEEKTNEKLEEILDLARNADYVIYCGGLNHDSDTEGSDRKDMKLPNEQNNIIDNLLEAREDALICLTAGSPVEMPWVNKAKVILWTWYAGMEGGNAFADILLGKISPSGNLQFTLTYRYEDTPVARYGEYNQNDEYYYDDIFIGYKGFNRDGIIPMFSFGHGLTDSEFNYSDFIVDRTNGWCSLAVENTGKADAKQVIQLYVGRNCVEQEYPPKELFDFEKVELRSGEKKTIKFKIHTDCEIYIGTAEDNIIFSS